MKVGILFYKTADKKIPYKAQESNVKHCTHFFILSGKCSGSPEPLIWPESHLSWGSGLVKKLSFVHIRQMIVMILITVYKKAKSK